jgi:hypothetical protein
MYSLKIRELVLEKSQGLLSITIDLSTIQGWFFIVIINWAAG